MNAKHYQALSPAVRSVVDASSSERASEAQISQAIDLILGDRRFYPDVLLHPNETGVLVDPEKGRHVRFGAGGKGGGDFIGIFKRADSIGLFIEAEIKRRDSRSNQSHDQRVREQLVRSFGGSYKVLRSVEDAERWIASLRENTW